MNSRIKELRKALRMTQTEFGDKIGCTRDAIAAYERGVFVKESIIKLICIQFSVSEEWLVNGTGEIFRELSQEEEIDSYMDTLSKNNDKDFDFQKRFIKVLSKLDLKDWNTLEKIVDEMAKEKTKL